MPILDGGNFMKKQFLFLLLFCLSISETWAERIDVATARKVAGNVARQESVTGLRSTDDLQLVYAARSGQSGSSLRSGTLEGTADYFVFNFPANKGFAIVSGDDRAYPVLGYSDEGLFDSDNLPDNLRGMLAYYQKQISWAEGNGIDATPAIAAEWERYLNGTTLRTSSKEVLLKTAKWGQGEPFNLYTPLEKGEHTLTGCVATASAILMHYHQYSADAEVLQKKGVSEYMGQKVTYAPYQWDKMLLEYNDGQYTQEEGEAVAALMWNIGANIKMQYSLTASSAFTWESIVTLRNLFGYSKAARYLFKSDFTWKEWKAMVRKELDENRPIVYEGYDSQSGHAFVCDGYREGEAFHINWGWSGYSDGYFLLTALDAEGTGEPFANNCMGIGIQKPLADDKAVCELRYDRLFMNGKPTCDDSFLIEITMVNIGSTTFKGEFGIAVIGTDGKIKKQIQSERLETSLDEIQYEKWKVHCSLSQDLSDGEVIKPVYNVDGEWRIMEGSSEAALYIDKNGVKYPGEDDSNEPDKNPLNIYIHMNTFGNTYLPVSGLDNGIRHEKCTQFIGYHITNLTDTIVFRYTLQDYEAWKGQLDIYTGEDGKSLSAENQGKKVELDESDSFEISVSPKQLGKGGYFWNFLKVLSAKSGELTYDIQVFDFSDKENLLFEQKGNKMKFMNHLPVAFDKDPIRGSVGQEIPFTVQMTDIDPIIMGKPLKVGVGIKFTKKKGGQIQLFDAEKKEIPLSYEEGELLEWDSAPVGNVVEDMSCTFYIKSDVEFLESSAPYFCLELQAEGYVIPITYKLASLVVDSKSPAANELVTKESVRVWIMGNRLFILTPKAEEAFIFTYDGRLYKSFSLSAGENVENLPQGKYIVRVGEQTYKLKN